MFDRLRKRCAPWLIGALSLHSSLFAFAQHPDEGGGSGAGKTKLNIDWAERFQAKTTLDPYEDDLLGDRIDPQTGLLTFETVDVSIPGNTHLEVAVRRQLDSNEVRRNAFGNWKLAVPRIYTKILRRENKTWGKRRCSQPLKDSLPTYNIRNGSSFVYPKDYSGGIQMLIPGQGTQTLLDKPQVTAGWPNAAVKTTVKGWYLTCLGNIDGAGTEGFVAHAPNGDTYRFDTIITRHDVTHMESWATNGAPRDPFDVSHQKHDVTVEMIAASRVTDVNGNWVSYNYDNRGRLLDITSSDQRRIDFEYDRPKQGLNGPIVVDDDKIDTVYLNKGTINERKWLYDYENERLSVYNNDYRQSNYKFENVNVLDKVTQPDGQYWDYDLGGLSLKATPGYSFTPPGGSARTCAQQKQTLKVKHPYGMTGTFVLEERTLTIGPNIPGGEPTCPGTLYGSTIGRSLELMTVTSKTLTAPNVPTMTWAYNYHHERSGSPGADTVTEVTRPDGTVQRYTHYNPFQSGGPNFTLAGKLKTLETFADSNARTWVGKQTYAYTKEASMGGNFAAGTSSTSHVPVRQTGMIDERDGDTYYTEYDYDTDRNSATYSYGHSTETRRWSNYSTEKRITTITYAHNLGQWVLGLPDTITHNGQLSWRYRYDARGRLTKEIRYGQDFAEYEYYDDGTVHWVEDGVARRTIARDWKRGKPQQVILPDNTAAMPSDYHQTIDDNGWVTSTTDPKNAVTSYGYDSMGRLTRIDLPSHWTDTDIAYTFNTPGVVQTTTKGHAQTITQYDAMLRPRQVHTTALDTDSGWTSYVNTNYNVMGQVAFQSQTTDNATETNGTDYTYDALGRPKQARENVFPFATTRYEYYDNHHVRVYDPSNAWRDYFSRGYDGPGNQDYRVIHVHSSDGQRLQTTEMMRDIRGQLTQVRQYGNLNGYRVDQSHYYYYNDQERLCRHYTPETDATLYDYNPAGDLVAYAEGQPNSGCGPIPDGEDKVHLHYDDRGRLTITDFARASNIVRGYDLNDNLVSMQRGATHWTYKYNDINLITDEQLDIGAPDNRRYTLKYIYNPNGHLVNKTLPSNTSVGFWRDSLGRLDGVYIPELRSMSSTEETSGGLISSISYEAVTLADDITYHPNGVLKGMLYGNGQTLWQQLDSRQYPSYLGTAGNRDSALGEIMSYDARGKMAAITDEITGDHYTYKYDGLGQLTSASGPWGAGSFRYDSLGNLRQKRLGSRTVDLRYDNRNRLVETDDQGGSSGRRSMTYDNRGNVTGLGALEFIYDTSNQPVLMLGEDFGQFVYDGHLRRVKVDFDDKTLYNIYDRSGALVHVDNVTDNQRTDYIDGPMGHLARITNSEITYLHPDYLGSALTGTNRDGEVIWRERYTPFGEPMVDDNANHNQAGFTGHIRDTVTGLNYMQARYYDPIAGRFLSNDPVGFSPDAPMQFNRYAYTWNDPINGIDPDGRRVQIATQFSSNDLEEILVTPSGGGGRTGSGCGCIEITGDEVRRFLEAWSNSLAGTIQTQLRFMGLTSGLGSAMLNEGSDTNEDNGGEVQEEYDSLEGAVGEVNPLDEVEYEGKTKQPKLRAQGYTEKWSGVDSYGEIQTAFKNPKTGKWTGGHRSSKNDKFW